MQNIWGCVYLQVEEHDLIQVLETLARRYLFSPLVSPGTRCSRLLPEHRDLHTDPHGQYMMIAWVIDSSTKLRVFGWGDRDESYPRLVHVSELVQNLRCNSVDISYHREEGVWRYTAYREGLAVERFNSLVFSTGQIDLWHHVFGDWEDPITIYAKSRAKRYAFFSLFNDHTPFRASLPRAIQTYFSKSGKLLHDFFPNTSQDQIRQALLEEDPVKGLDLLLQPPAIPGIGELSIHDLVSRGQHNDARVGIWRHPKSEWLRPSEL